MFLQEQGDDIDPAEPRAMATLTLLKSMLVLCEMIKLDLQQAMGGISFNMEEGEVERNMQEMIHVSDIISMVKISKLTTCDCSNSISGSQALCTHLVLS